MRFFDWFFRDRRSGQLVIGQWPNLALTLFIVTSLAVWLVGRTADAAAPMLIAGLRFSAMLSLAWWSADELLRGVNPWRRCLGAAVMSYALWLGWHQIRSYETGAGQTSYRMSTSSEDVQRSCRTCDPAMAQACKV